MPAAVLLTAKHIHFHSFVLSLSKRSELIKEDGIHAQSEIIKDLRNLWTAKPPLVLQEQRKDESIDPVHSFDCFCGEQFIIISGLG